jgi:hypothetical protein
MSSGKKKALDDIAKRVEKRKQIRSRHISIPDDATRFVFDYFKTCEDTIKSKLQFKEKFIFVLSAQQALSSRLRVLDPNIRAVVPKVRWDEDSDFISVDGVTIEWSSAYQAKTGCDPSVHIDSGEMLLY